MRAIGFSAFEDRAKLQELLKDVIMHPDTHSVAENSQKVLLGEFTKEFAPGVGITVCGEYEKSKNKPERFLFDYYYPYLSGQGVTSCEDISIDRHAEKDSYAGVCDDLKVGISLIFYLRNKLPYVRAQASGKLPIRGTTLTLSALSNSGCILLPIQKDEEQIERIRQATVTRNNLMAAARKGDEDAIETLTLEDMDMYSAISKKIKKEDVFSLVDTSFMPYGVESDHYSVVGEITDMKTVTNQVTGESMYIFTIYTNELTFDVCINKMDLFGEPQVGRRFKGVIWLLGNINFPEEAF
jgi:hypothetical protein